MADCAGEPVGFITVSRHFRASAEIYCMAVHPEHHRRGVGKALVRFVEGQLVREGARFLQVKTLGPSRPCAAYERTRRFYKSMAFVPLEEFKDLWPGNPCLVLVKSLG